MGVQIKKGVPSWMSVDTDFDVFGDQASFAMEIINASTGAVVVNDGTGTFEEVMWSDSAHSGTTSGTTLVGATSVVLAVGNDFVPGDRIDDGAGNIYYISVVDGDIIHIKGEIKAEITDATALVTVGNTGMYRVDVNIANAGDYFVNFSHPEMGHTAAKVTVVENTVDDVYNRLDGGLNALGANKTMKVIA